MQKIKNEKGVTLIALTVTIIIMVILAGISITSGVISVQNSEDDNYKGSLNIVQQAVVTQYQKIKTLNKANITPNASFSNKPDFFVGDIITNFSTISSNGVPWKVSSFNYYEDYYYRITKDTLTELGITNGEYTYIVNYKTGEVYNESKKKTSLGELLYISALRTNSTESAEVDNTFATD